MARRRHTRPGAVFTVLFVVCAMLFAAGTALAAPLFSDGFESGTLSNWTASSGFAVQQQVVFDGLRAGRATTTGSPVYAYKTLSGSQTNLYADVHMNLLSAAATVQFLRFMSSTGSSIVGLAMKSSGSLILWNYVTGTSRTSTTAVIGKKAWHDVQLHATISSTSSQAEVWLDGTKVSDLSGTYSLGSNAIGRVLLGTSGKTSSFDMAFDDLVVDPAFVGGTAFDTTPPSVPTGLTATNIYQFQVDLGWRASTDDFGVRGYTVYRDGIQIGTSSTLSFSDRAVSPSTTYSYTLDAFDGAGNHSVPSGALSVTTPAPTVGSSTIQHVVILDQENHSFDDTLGKLCAAIAAGTITGHQACDGATQGVLSTGQVIPLSQEPDVVPPVGHGVSGQQAAIDGGRMDGFDKVSGCTSSDSYACYAQFDPSQIPNLTRLASTFVISDRTFEFATTPSWGGHLVLATATLDGFDGNNPTVSTYTSKTGAGWGCDSYRDAKWWNGTKYVLEPSCIPDQNGQGPYRASPVAYVPTIFDRLDAVGLTWKIYGGGTTGLGYGWSICPSFFECVGSARRNNLVDASTVVTDAQAGSLPSLSIITPTLANSQHNQTSMAQGDNWIGQVVSAIEGGPEWSSTAIFITYDDCGCFYDHVAPPSAGTGIRVPMVIVSPYAKAGFTDSSTATYMGLLAYTEHTFGLSALGSADANAYDYSNSFDYAQTPLSGTTMTHTRVSAKERAYIKAHPPRENDPT